MVDSCWEDFLNKETCTCKSGNVVAALWEKKKKYIVNEAFRAGFFTEIVDKNLPYLKSKYIRCQKNNILYDDFYVVLSKELRSHTFIVESLLRCVGNRVCESMQVGKSLAPWEMAYAMYCSGVTWGLEPQCYPDESEFALALENEDPAKKLPERLEVALPYYCALLSLQKFKSLLKWYLEEQRETQADIKSGEISSLENTEIFYGILGKFLRARRLWAGNIRVLRPSFDAVAHESVSLEECLSAPKKEFAVRLEQRWQDIHAELVSACSRAVPKKFDAEALRALLRRVMPPFSEDDWYVAEKEIASLAAGELAEEKSPLLSLFLPALRGERKLDWSQMQGNQALITEFRYSFALINNLCCGEYALPEENGSASSSEDAQDVAADEEPATPEDKSAAEDAPEMKSPLSVGADTREEVLETENSPEHTDEEGPDSELDEVSLADAPADACTGNDACPESPDAENAAPSEKVVATDTGNAACLESSKAEDVCVTESERQDDVEKLRADTDIDYQQFACEHLDARLKPRVIRPVSEKMPGRKTDAGMSSGNGKFPGHASLSLDFAELQRMAQDGNMGELGRKLFPGMSGPSTVSDAKKVGADEAVAGEGKKSGESASESAPDTCASRLDKGIAAVIAGREGKVVSPDARGDIGTSVKALIVQNDTCGLYWLARTLGEDSPVPVWLAELLHLGTHLLPQFTGARARILDLCRKAAMGTGQNLGEKNSLLLAAAILRPALMMPEASMLTITSALSDTLKGCQCPSFLKELRTFISRGTPMDDAVFLGKSTEWQRSQVQHRLTSETEDFLDRLSRGKLSYQPATQLRKKLFNPRGEVGKLLHACLRGESSSLDAFIQRYSDPRNIETLIEKKIKADARQKLLNDVKLGVELLKRWRGFLRNTDVDLSYMETVLSDMYREMSGTDKLKESVEGCLLREQMQALYRHELAEEPCDPLEYLQLWPLRIAGSWQREGTVFELPLLISALHRREFEQAEVVAASLALHMAAGRIDEVNHFLSKFAEYKDKTPACSVLEAAAPSLAAALPFSLLDVKERSSILWEREFSRRIDNLNEYISDCYFRGAIHYSQQGQSYTRFSRICTQYRGVLNKAPALREIQSLYKDLRQWDEARLGDVLQRLKELKSLAGNTGSAFKFLKKIEEDVKESHLYSAAWDNIARLEDFLISQKGELPPEQEEEPVEASAARTFYELLEKGLIREPAKGMEVWKNALPLRRERSGARYTGIITELLRWLGFTLDAKVQAEDIFAERAPYYWHIFRYSMELSDSPLPQWGSRAGGKHVIVLGWDASAADIGRLMTNNYIGEGEAVTVICFGTLSAEERKKILSLGKSWPSFPLIVDSNLMAFLAGLDGEKRVKALFDVALAGAPCNPYTPDVAGAVPREMFFGREKDRKGVLAVDGPCILYGGRQLGKSALLEQVFRCHNDPSIKVILHIMRRQETSIVDVILGECVKEKIVGPNTTRKTLQDNIVRWLNESGHRLLVLLDECDAVLDEDARQSFRDVEEIRNLMQTTSRRFKVVFTGLHSVQRFSHVPNSPLYHFGEPICIGPLSTDAAYSLMTKPMAILGLEFETHKLVQMALNHCNYQPKIIQMFCSELVDAIEREQSRGPLYTINKTTMLKVYESQNLKKKIRDCFDMTLNLDPRYLVIGYTMALQQDRDMTLNELLAELRGFWPAAFATSGNDAHTLQSLLHEMEGLGLVISLGGSYRLRTPNVVELLGGEENVLQKLEQYAFLPYQPEGDPDELRIPGADVFVATQYNLLADKASRLCWVSGSPALGLKCVPEALNNIVKATSEAGNSTFKCVEIVGRDDKEVMSNIRATYDKYKEGGMLFWLDASGFPYIGRFLKEADRWINGLRTGKKFVKIVCVVEPESLYHMIKNGENEKFSSYQVPLVPWTESSVERWCREYALTGRNAHEIMQDTAGWSCLVQERLGIQRNTRKGGLKICDFIPDTPELLHILNILKELGDEACSEEDILALVEPRDENESRIFRQGISLLRELYILREKGEKLSLDCVMAQVL